MSVVSRDNERYKPQEKNFGGGAATSGVSLDNERRKPQENFNRLSPFPSRLRRSNFAPANNPASYAGYL